MAQAQAEILLGIPSMRYELTRPLFDGRVSVEGVKLQPAETLPVIYEELPDLKEGDFGLCDLNIGYLLPAIEAGWQLTAIPLFTSRSSACQNIYVRADRGIEKPRDLEGKTVATRTFRTAFTIWVRGLLQHRHGVDPARIRWLNQMNEVFPIYDDQTQRVPGDNRGKHPLDSLLDGDADAAIAAIFGPRSIEAFEADPRVKRLFPDYMREDERLYHETGIYTPVRVLAISKKLDHDHPDLARRLYDAFSHAKELAYEEVISQGTTSALLYHRERMLEQKRRWGDPFKYGIKANRSTMDTFIQYNYEQGLIRSPLSYEQIFAPATLDT